MTKYLNDFMAIVNINTNYIWNAERHFPCLPSNKTSNNSLIVISTKNSFYDIGDSIFIVNNVLKFLLQISLLMVSSSLTTWVNVFVKVSRRLQISHVLVPQSHKAEWVHVYKLEMWFMTRVLKASSPWETCHRLHYVRVLNKSNFQANMVKRSDSCARRECVLSSSKDLRPVTSFLRQTSSVSGSFISQKGGTNLLNKDAPLTGCVEWLIQFETISKLIDFCINWDFSYIYRYFR